jgi:hypothetical protein
MSPTGKPGFLHGSSGISAVQKQKLPYSVGQNRYWASTDSREGDYTRPVFTKN